MMAMASFSARALVMTGPSPRPSHARGGPRIPPAPPAQCRQARRRRIIWLRCSRARL
jgi:hypothetical protein